MKTCKQDLEKAGACSPAIKVHGNQTAQEAWDTCTDSSWMFYAMRTKAGGYDYPTKDIIVALAKEFAKIAKEHAERAKLNKFVNAYADATAYADANAAATAAADANAYADATAYAAATADANAYAAATADATAYATAYADATAGATAYAATAAYADAYADAKQKQKAANCDIIRKAWSRIV